MNGHESLLRKVAHFENLETAYRRCARGKRRTSGFRQSVFNLGKTLMKLEKSLLDGSFQWHGYREFYVHDPKRRLVMAAPFLDRVVHHALHLHLEPFLDAHLSDAVFACRRERGNRLAVLELMKYLHEIGPDRFTIKLDVEKFYESINLRILFRKVIDALPDSSLEPLLWSLFQSHDEYAQRGHGIPIGNLTSQLFANFYLASADHEALVRLKKGRLFRYMDDFVLVGPDKSEVMRASSAVVEHVEKELNVHIPFHKRVPLGNAPIPFLGFVVDHQGYRILTRNRRRFAKKLKRLRRAEARDSEIARVNLSFQAWQNLIPEANLPDEGEFSEDLIF